MLYLVGGCPSDFWDDKVRRYDPATDSWELLADYPEPTAGVACGALAGRLVCAGGTGRDGTVGASRHTFSYNPRLDRWSARANLPIPLSDMAYTAVRGKLLVSGGVTGRGETLTNRRRRSAPRLRRLRTPDRRPVAQSRSLHRHAAAR